MVIIFKVYIYNCQIIIKFNVDFTEILDIASNSKVY